MLDVGRRVNTRGASERRKSAQSGRGLQPRRWQIADTARAEVRRSRLILRRAKSDGNWSEGQKRINCPPRTFGRLGAKHARKKYGKYKICDERFYSCWGPGLVEVIFPDWF